MRAMSVPKVPTEIRRAAEQEAARHDCTVTFRQGGKHPFVMYLERNGICRSISLSLRDHAHQINWIRQDIRRLARQLA